MAAMKEHKGLLKRLKKQVTALKRKEKASRNKLRAALAKVKKLGKMHTRKLEQHKKTIGKKVAMVEATAYTRLAKSILKRAKKVKKGKKTRKAVSKQAHKPASRQKRVKR